MRMRFGARVRAAPRSIPACRCRHPGPSSGPGETGPAGRQATRMPGPASLRANAQSRQRHPSSARPPDPRRGNERRPWRRCDRSAEYSAPIFMPPMKAMAPSTTSSLRWLRMLRNGMRQGSQVCRKRAAGIWWPSALAGSTTEIAAADAVQQDSHLNAARPRVDQCSDEGLPTESLRKM